MNIKLLAARILLFCLCLSCVNGIITFADGLDAENGTVTEAAEPRAVSLGYKYQRYNGICYRRMWNYTAGEWYDSVWTVCPDATHEHSA